MRMTTTTTSLNMMFGCCVGYGEVLFIHFVMPKSFDFHN